MRCAVILVVTLLNSCTSLALIVHMMVSTSPITRDVEVGLQRRGFRYIIGSDESGRGSIAGPMVVASCCIKTELDKYNPIAGVNDSKALTASERNRIYEYVVSHPEVYAYTVAEKSNKEIDDLNILIATTECFRQSIESLVLDNSFPLEQTYSIVDGKKTPMLSIGVPCRPWVRGDAQVYTVALASIMAKVTRDKIMTDSAHAVYPHYRFNKHKGYPTREHIQAIHTHGACPLHRMSFKPVRGRQFHTCKGF